MCSLPNGKLFVFMSELQGLMKIYFLYWFFEQFVINFFLISSLAPLVAHPQNINGLRRSFLCRVKKTEGDTAPSRVGEGGAEVVPDSTTGQNLYSLSAQKEGGGMAGANFNESESVLKLIQSSQEALPHQYAVLHCTGYIR